MFQIDDDMTIYITRGDMAYFSVTAENNGELHTFRKGDVVRIKVFKKKDCTNVAFQKDFAVVKDCTRVDILLTEEETKIGDVISKPVDYWYEIELNPYTNPQTIVGYDDDGAKIFRVFPEGKDLTINGELKEEDIPLIDSELSLTSEKPVQNQAVAKALLILEEKNNLLKNEFESHKNGVEAYDDYVISFEKRNVEKGYYLGLDNAVEQMLFHGSGVMQESNYFVSCTAEVKSGDILKMESSFECVENEVVHNCIIVDETWHVTEIIPLSVLNKTDYIIKTSGTLYFSSAISWWNWNDADYLFKIITPASKVIDELKERISKLENDANNSSNSGGAYCQVLFEGYVDINNFNIIDVPKDFSLDDQKLQYFKVDFANDSYSSSVLISADIKERTAIKFFGFEDGMGVQNQYVIRIGYDEMDGSIYMENNIDRNIEIAVTKISAIYI